MLAASVGRNRADALLLSGGLDSAVIASIACPAYTVTAGYGADAPDLAYARQVAQKYSQRHVEVVFAEDEMGRMAEQVIRTFRTFDPIEVRNSCVALAGLEQAKKDGHNRVMTGDGGDELFAGYNYLSRYHDDPARLQQELERLWEVMHFSSAELGRLAGVQVLAPFLDAEFAAYAKSLDVAHKVGQRNGRTWGKFILRACFEGELGPLVAWREKMAQEQGGATDRFHDFVESMIDDATFANRKKTAESEGVAIRSKEHLNYYAIFRSYFPPPREGREGHCRLGCPACGACMAETSNSKFCRTCGAFPVSPVPLLL